MRHLKTVGSIVAALALAAGITSAEAGILHRYSFNTDANDLVGTAHGTLLNGAVISNNAVALNVPANGTAYVNLPNGIISSLTNVTIEAWVTPVARNAWGRVFDFGNSNAGEDGQGTGLNYLFLTTVAGNGAAGNTLRFAYRNTIIGAENPIINGPIITNNLTYHFAVVYSPSDNFSGLYVNGVQVATNTATGPLSAIIDENNWLGKSQWNDPYFRGSIDEFRIWDNRLTALQIATNFTNGPNNPGHFPPVAANDAASVVRGGAVVVNVLQNDAGQGATLNSNSVVVVTPPANGTAQVQAGGSILYSHNGGVSTSDSFTYTVTDSLGTISPAATVSLTINPLPGALLHRYSFNTNANDLVGTAHGTLNSGALITNGAVSLDGTNDFVNLPNGIISTLTNVTIEAWVKQSASNVWGRVFDLGSNTGGEDGQGTGTSYMFLTTAAGGTGALRFAYTTNSNGAENPILNGPIITNNVPYYLTVVYSPGDNFSGLYVNGALAASGIAVNPLSAIADINNWLGKSQWIDPYFKGTIDEFRIWNGRLGASQIASNNVSGPDNFTFLPPLAVNDVATVAPGGAAVINVLQNDVAQGSAFNVNSVVVLSAPTNGTAQVQPGGGVLYTHNGGPSTTDSFTYRVSDSTGTQSQPATVLININFVPPGLVHRYNFNSDANDSAGSANGILMNGAFLNNGSVVLDGANDFVDLPNGIISSLTDTTIEVWATRSAANAWGRIFDFGSSSGGEGNQGVGVTYVFLTANAGGGGPLRFAYTTSGGAGEFPILNGPALTNNLPYYFAVVYNPSGNSSALYVNGVQVATGTATGPLSALADFNNWLGRSQYNDPYFGGSIDEFRIWSTPFGATQIATNYSNGPNVMALLPPVANNDSMTLNPGAAALINVLQNDVAQGSPLNPAAVSVVNPPANGIAQVKPDGRILYTHNGGPGSADSFTYRVQDVGGQTSAVATVSITVSPNLRLPNTTVTVPNNPPPVSYQVVDAYPGIVFTNPLALRTPPSNTNMLFVVERSGVVSYLTNLSSGTPTRVVFMNIGNQISYDAGGQGERGLLSLAFHPNFASNGYFFVTYMAPGGNPYLEKLARFQANPTNFTVATNTQTNFFTTTKRAFNHNGADIHFGNDGYLYVGMGDEGDQYNVRTNAQRLDLALFAGMLRIDVDKKPGNFEPTTPSTGNTVVLTIPTNGSGQAMYSIPSDNPFIGATVDADGRVIDTNHLRSEFYAIGMRHLWRFSVDKPTGDIWIGIVGQDQYEGVYKLRKGGNYGWPYYEAAHLSVPLYGTNTHPGLRNPPPGFVLDAPLFEYPHNGVAGADPSFAGLDVNGSYFYRGKAIPELTNAYLFGDFDTGGNIWALRVSNDVVSVERLGGMTGISAFGADPLSGEVLMCNYLQNKIQKLIKADADDSTFPQKLSDTGIFADLGTLSPNPGIVSYSPNVAFWSDYAIKTRWFTIPDLVSTVNFTSNGGWGLPTGMKWIKHFDLELNRGNPLTKKRIETRVLVKTAGGIYGVSYKWNDTQDEAFLVADSGDLFQLTVTNAGVPFQQDWEIPSRSSCLSCHTPVAGFALTFNTREMNKDNPMNGINGNQIQTMSSGGYFSAAVPNPHTLPAFATATDTNFSLEYRVRSYLAVNCVQCHQPGGAGQGLWDARPELTLAQTGMINGTPVANDGGNPLNKIIVPGDTNHSVLLLRLENTNGFSRMPPLATHQLDLASIGLVQNWITQELPGHPTYAQWITNYPSLIGPAADPGADPDGDGANNYFEYLTGTDPTSALGTWKPTIQVVGATVQVSYPQVPNLGVVIDVSTDLATWTPWDVPGNQPLFASFPGTRTVSGPVSTVPPFQFFRARLIQP